MKSGFTLLHINYVADEALPLLMLMKRLLLLLTLFLMGISAYSQVSYGKFVMFPDAKLVGSMWKPQIDFVRMDESDIICIRTCSSDTYKSFDAESRVLIRFSDSTMVKLPIIEELDVVKDYDNEWIASSLTEKYITFSYYSIEAETIDKIIEDKVPIIKIRLVFTNGNIQDYDIPKNYQQKLLDGLIASRKDAISTNHVRKTNQSDDTF